MAALAHGVVVQPVIGETRCGDAYAIVDRGDYFVVAVADGLGHGPDAAVASARAIAIVEAEADKMPGVLLQACHTALRGTRGAVLAIARVDRRTGVLVHAGIGNIETRLVGLDKTRRPVTVNGIVGDQPRKTREESFPFAPGDLLVMHSDGISERFEMTSAARNLDLQGLAERLTRDHGRMYDDQLMLVVKDTP